MSLRPISQFDPQAQAFQRMVDSGLSDAAAFAAIAAILAQQSCGSAVIDGDTLAVAIRIGAEQRAIAERAGDDANRAVAAGFAAAFGATLGRAMQERP